MRFLPPDRQETATVLDVSTDTVSRTDVRQDLAVSWLRRDGPNGDAGTSRISNENCRPTNATQSALSFARI